ncbi:CRISPR/Cas system endoribonuclease Cas6 (RAMP superfamily) [Aequitasia blattaphilus]|uniref:CRISPR system precrRNA processing endoribonuclease RAMP protein Cas6 n=1 Tax=Aequitasia blattaphilus TaxID=2949332 RepID=A0ABT1EC03_9FIRM|nr:CRISPR system precrRNA processing endoribonuclease RAMP protein Cas6 [Aequitasia blattaphilus]MCP1102037.1 CRISPR system precrRNA processing endoribonuclease RAMP protein Cas6 [Aequitasia blattaphilus]MCR8614677.1 CRISPR system precrRNA processing endoribonuclease RAMP protein Cas6 [Aequitasia blattaphilus]
MNTYKNIFELKYIPIRVCLVAMENATLPEYLGSTIRGVIGQALYQNQEAYQYIYQNRKLSDNKQDIVNPYIIVPSQEERTKYKRGEQLFFEIRLFGDAKKYMKELIEALEKIDLYGLGVSRYKFTLDKVIQPCSQRIIWQDRQYIELAAKSVSLPCLHLKHVKKARLYLQTPLRIRRGGKLLLDIDFPTIIRNITSRIETLTRRYGGTIDESEMIRVNNLAKDVLISEKEIRLKEMNRYSNRLNQKMDFSGLQGMIEFEGKLDDFVPWIYAAQTIHIGRNTTFGMGKIEVEFL